MFLVGQTGGLSGGATENKCFVPLRDKPTGQLGCAFMIEFAIGGEWGDHGGDHRTETCHNDHRTSAPRRTRTDSAGNGRTVSANPSDFAVGEGIGLVFLFGIGHVFEVDHTEFGELGAQPTVTSVE